MNTPASANAMKSTQELQALRARIKSGIFRQNLFAFVGVLFTSFAVLVLLAAFLDLLTDGLPRLSWDFLTNFPSRRAGQAGILSAWVGSALVMLLTMLSAVPIGIGAAIYLEEYAGKNWFTDLIEINVTNLAGVPSIVYGLLALGLFVYQFGFGESILDCDRVVAGSAARCSDTHSRSGLRRRSNTLADGERSPGALFAWRHDDGCDLGYG
jgi:phosphate transport system permease protein